MRIAKAIIETEKNQINEGIQLKLIIILKKTVPESTSIVF